MPLSESVVLAVIFLVVAALYSGVGNAGAPGYLAIMALFGMTDDVMTPTAFVLNILVSSIATVRFVRSGLFSWRVLWPFLLGAVPLAYVGGAIQLPGHVCDAGRWWAGRHLRRWLVG